MKTLSRIILGLALAAPLTIRSAVRADDKTTSSDNRQDVTMDQLPKPVKSTVQREGKSKNVQSMTKSTDSSGVVAYEIRYLDGSKETTIDVATNGKVLVRHVRVVEAQPGQPGQPNQPNQINQDTQNSPQPNQNAAPNHPNPPNQINQNTQNNPLAQPKNDPTSNETKPTDTRQNP